MTPSSFHYEQLRQILELNNQGASLVEARDFKKAVALLGDALALSRQRVVQDPRKTDHSSGFADIADPSSRDDEHVECSSSSTLSSRSISSRENTMTPPSTEQHQCLVSYSLSQSKPAALHEGLNDDDQISSSSFLYRHPIRFPLQEEQLMNYALFDLDVTISAAIIFNLALIHQLYAEQQDSESMLEPEDSRTTAETKKIMLEKSVRLYEFVHHLLSQQHTALDLNALFLLATINNLGQAYRTLDESSLKASSCFEQLMSFLMLLLDDFEGQQDSQSQRAAFLEAVMSTAIQSTTKCHNYSAGAA